MRYSSATATYQEPSGICGVHWGPIKEHHPSQDYTLYWEVMYLLLEEYQRFVRSLTLPPWHKFSTHMSTCEKFHGTYSHCLSNNCCKGHVLELRLLLQCAKSKSLDLSWQPWSGPHEYKCNHIQIHCLWGAFKHHDESVLVWSPEYEENLNKSVCESALH